MSEIIEKEIITQENFWFSNTVRYSEKQMEYEALRLTNKSKCTFVKLTYEECINQNKKKMLKYFIIAEGTKQHLLLLKHLMTSWVWGSNFHPTETIDL